MEMTYITGGKTLLTHH